MFDAVAIIISSVLVIYTIVKAVKLDKELEWFNENEDDIPPK